MYHSARGSAPNPVEVRVPCIAQRAHSLDAGMLCPLAASQGFHSDKCIAHHIQFYNLLIHPERSVVTVQTEALSDKPIHHIMTASLFVDSNVLLSRVIGRRA